MSIDFNNFCKGVGQIVFRYIPAMMANRSACHATRPGAISPAWQSASDGAGLGRTGNTCER